MPVTNLQDGICPVFRLDAISTRGTPRGPDRARCHPPAPRNRGGVYTPPRLLCSRSHPRPRLVWALFRTRPNGLLLFRVGKGGGRELPVPGRCPTGTRTRALPWAGGRQPGPPPPRSSSSSRRCCPGKSRLETSALGGPGGRPALGAGTRGGESGRPRHRAAPPDRPRGGRRAGLEPGPAWPREEAGQQRGHGRSGAGMTRGQAGPGARGEADRAGRHPRPARLPARGPRPAVTCCSARGRACEARAATRARPLRVGIRCGSRCGARAQGAAARDQVGGRERRTMRPAHNCAARVGPGGARVAGCVCVRLSVNPDRPPPIG